MIKISRFFVTTLVALLLAGAAFLGLGGSARVGVLVVIAIVYATIFVLGVCRIGMQFFGPAICRGKPGQNRVALTFDDGPDPATTPALLDLLDREKISAAFFCIGKKVADHPELAYEIIRRGHVIGNHTYNHAWWTNFLTAEPLSREIDRAQMAIHQAARVHPDYMRPPMGLTNPHYAGVLPKLGLKMIGWDVRSLDRRLSTDRVVARVLQKTSDGSIILLHEGGSAEEVVQRVAKIIHELRSRGLDFARLDHLIGEDASNGD